MTNSEVEKQFQKFINDKKHIRLVKEKTLKLYNTAWLAWKRYGGEDPEDGASDTTRKYGVITTRTAKDFIVRASEDGLSPGGISAYARSMNAFFTWLYGEEKTKTHIKIPRPHLKKKPLKTYSEDAARELLLGMAETGPEKRLLAMLHLLVDTGVRIDEALELRREDCHFDQLYITVKGKGDKIRHTPVSFSCASWVTKWLRTHDHELVFCTGDGNKVRYDNLRRDFLRWLKKCQVDKSEGAFHAFRRLFARKYLTDGGGIRDLQLRMGHDEIDTTTVYLDDDLEAISPRGRRMSVLDSIKDGGKKEVNSDHIPVPTGRKKAGKRFR